MAKRAPRITLTRRANGRYYLGMDIKAMAVIGGLVKLASEERFLSEQPEWQAHLDRIYRALHCDRPSDPIPTPNSLAAVEAKQASTQQT